jgi:hypothetical protein
MRGLVVLAALVMGACKDEPSFDQRYEQAERHIRTKAAEIDRELHEDGNRDAAPAP